MLGFLPGDLVSADKCGGSVSESCPSGVGAWQADVERRGKKNKMKKGRRGVS